MSATDGMASSALDRARSKAFWHLLPLCFFCYVLSYVDRTNISIAKLTMKGDLPWFTDKVFGDGSGLFFPGYVVLAIPGALIVERWGARKLITGSMVCWGIVAGAMAFISSPLQFYVFRFLLGVAEAGFFPGMIVFLTHWFPTRDRARATATLIIATPFSQIVSPKLSGAMLHMDMLGLKGWQWMFINWAVPAVVLGALILLLLPDRPSEARWLTAEERDALEQELARERLARAGKQKMKVLEALTHPKVLLLALAYFLAVSANYGLEFFLPTMLKDWYKLPLDTITWLLMLPPAAALTGQLFAGWHSDLRKERRLHTVVPLLIGAVTLVLVSRTQGALALTMACFVLAAAGIKSYQPSFWALPPLLLSEAAAAGSIGFINAIGNLGGAFGSSMMGRVRTATGSYGGGLTVLSVAMLASAAIIFFIGLGKRTES
ncbi:MAG TPA: MFS transporter [Polyangia bacterium]|nr:MFS transporter [Polyangia bacterium]